MNYRMLRKTELLVLSVVLLGAVHGYSAELKFGRYYSDGMVLQREKPVKVCGLAAAEAEITVAFAGQKKTSTADKDGNWSVTLDTMKANSQGQPLTAHSSIGNLKSEIGNVLVGDVLLFARQTSMDVSLGSTDEGKHAAQRHKTSPNFRVISIKTIPSLVPQKDLAAESTDGWREVNGDSALKMNAAAYYVGMDIGNRSEVPVGIIDLNMGSQFPVSWLSREELEKTEMLYGRTDVPGQLERFDQAAKIAATNGVVEPGGKESLSSNFVEYALAPSAGYNAAIHPMRGTALKAVLLQLGNDYPYMPYDACEQSADPFNRTNLNIAYIQTYDIRKVGFRMEPVTLPRVPREWRKAFGNADLPFGLIVPPASDLNTLSQHHREMRELQRLMGEDNKHVGIILPGMAHRRLSAQPLDDKLLADRCVNWLKGAVYNVDGIVPAGPLFERVECSYNKATVHFKKGTASGLKAGGKALDYFEAAGVEGDYFPAKAEIDGETVRLESDTIKRIMRVRYNWNRNPDQNLVNAAGLPAAPFRSERADYHWFVTNEDDDLPEEYHTPANTWKAGDVALINGQLKTVGYDNFCGWVGPAGFLTGPFGPNMGVREVKLGSPAYGKVFVGDVIYSANGKMLGDKAWDVIGAALTESETEEAGGKLMLGVRRDGKNIDIDLKLEVMGEYSSTAPFDCLKTEKIVSNLEKWVVKNGADAGFLNYDALFMLATGNPEMQGYVRRIVYNIIKDKDPNRSFTPETGGKSWANSAEAILLGEYYLATGDKNVLPHLKHACARLAATQHPTGGWRHGFPGADHYGLIPNAGLPGVMGMYFAKAAGLDINTEAYERSVDHYSKNRAETGFLIYGIGPLCEREEPVVFEPETMNAGKMVSYNGGLSAAGILMKFAGMYRAANLTSLISSFAWNNTFEGHGGNFWNNFWTPLGAHQHGKGAFVNFWKNYRWYSECNRMFDGSMIQHEDGRAGAANGTALCAPRKRIQIVGAPTSPFSTNAPAALKPAVEKYWEKDYDGCEQMAEALLSSGTVAQKDLPTVAYLARQAKDMKASIAADCNRIQTLAAEGDPDQARTFLPGLSAVLPDGDQRLIDLEKVLESAKPVLRKSVEANNDSTEVSRQWVRLVSEISGSSKDVAGPRVINKPEASVWKLYVVEALSQAPEGWQKPAFDDSAWKETVLPVSWRMYHTALLRTKFMVEDKTVLDGLRFYAWIFRQQGVEIYLNGELVAKVNNVEAKTGDIEGDFLASALKHIRNGENTLAITTRHNWRWGMLFMKVYNDGFDFNLDARLKL